MVRSSMEVVHDVLSVCNLEPSTKSTVLRRTRLNPKQLNRSLPLLSTNELITQDEDGCYHLTLAGQRLLKRVSRTIRAMRRFEQELGKGRLGADLMTGRSSTSDQLNMLTVAEAAERLRAHAHSVRRWADMGILPSHRVGVRGDRRFRRQDLDKFLVPGDTESYGRPDESNKLEDSRKQN